MKKITRELVESLSLQHDGAVISIYMPTHRFPSSPHMQEDQTRYKNLVNEAKAEAESKTDGHKLGEFYNYLMSKLDEVEFWQEATEGLAIFANPELGYLSIYRLPVECQERVSVGPNYDITPLLLLLSYNQQYYVLALAEHAPKLFRGDMYGLEYIEMDFPESPEKAFNIDEMYSGSNTVRGHGGNGNSSGKLNGSSPHGQGDSNTAGKEERLNYFRVIDQKIVSSRDIDKALPFLLAAPEKDAGDYRAMSKLHLLVDDFLRGNYTNETVHKLAERTWPIIQKNIGGQKSNKAIEQFNRQFGISRSSGDLSGIETAVKQGRVSTLLLGMLAQTADSVSDSTRRDIPKIMFNENYERLADLARAVFAQGGKIVGMLPESMPSHTSAAALYRY